MAMHTTIYVKNKHAFSDLKFGGSETCPCKIGMKMRSAQREWVNTHVKGQWGQVNGLSPLWKNLCAFKVPFEVKALPQISQT